MKLPDNQDYGAYLCSIKDEYDESFLEEKILYWDCFYIPVEMKSYDNFEDYKNACIFHKESAWCFWEDGGFLVRLPGNKIVVKWEKIDAIRK